MQPLGRQHCKFPGPAKEDAHPGKGYMNWWEDIIPAKKKTARRKDKFNIQEEINGYFKNI